VLLPKKSPPSLLLFLLRHNKQHNKQPHVND
jgi:hypothetical protein